jgi:threonylcarbamoyladenosine tRNA methylthiotransferase MtaB
MQREFARTFIGQELEVVIEGGIHNGQRKGLSQNYLPVYLPAEQVRPGECHKVKITSTAGEGLLGDMYK